MVQNLAGIGAIDNMQSMLLLLSHAFMSHEQWHRQPSEAAAGHPAVWSVDSC